MAPWPDNGFLIRRLEREGAGIEVQETLEGRIAGILVALLAASFGFHFVAQRIRPPSEWRRLRYLDCVVILLLLIAWLSGLCNSVMQFAGFQLDENPSTCQASAFACIVGYYTFKLLFLFLAERVYVIHGNGAGRLKSKLNIGNMIGVTLAYVVWIPVVLIFRVNHITSGSCVIGIQQEFLSAVLTSDMIMSLWLTGWFIYPLLKSRGISLKQKSVKTDDPRSARLRSLALRTLIGTLITMFATTANLTLVIVRNGSSAWLCLMLCKVDLFICSAVVYWVTERDGVCDKRRVGHRQWTPARGHADACTKVPGSCCSGLQGTTLFTGSLATGATGHRGRQIFIPEIHPGDLVPGSMYLGSGTQPAVNDIPEAHGHDQEQVEHEEGHHLEV